MKTKIWVNRKSLILFFLILILSMNESYSFDSTKTNINYEHRKTIWQNIGNDFGIFFKTGEHI